ncbi:translation factor [Hortaea werneckii]|nr:translation factor [Hortaea werneckii]
MAQEDVLATQVLPVDTKRLGKLQAVPVSGDVLDDFTVKINEATEDGKSVQSAAEQLRTSDIPVAFPTETVYGLGADATRSTAVRGIYKAKKRPVDNPLIVHFASLRQLRALLNGQKHSDKDLADDPSGTSDPIPNIYKPLIEKYWPGPLTILLNNPANSPLAPEVTAGLSTFGARMPRHPLALALIKLADVPVAAPSANASTKPSPTAAEHVAYDLDGRLETILDGGPCDVGVESTVVDGLSQPPLILRPGGISIEQLRSCPGWENVQVGYKNAAETGSQPRAPGMKYRHYSPKATVVLFEATKPPPANAELREYLGPTKRLGVVRTKSWALEPDHNQQKIQRLAGSSTLHEPSERQPQGPSGFEGLFRSLEKIQPLGQKLQIHECNHGGLDYKVYDIFIGPDPASVARGVFAALRELDRQDVDTILVEGIDDSRGDTAAAVMNRLRKAAEIKIAS